MVLVEISCAYKIMEMSVSKFLPFIYLDITLLLLD